MNHHLTKLFVLAKIQLDHQRDERGASLVEYALLIALIAVVCIAAVSLLGNTAKEPFSDVTSRLGSTA